MPRKNGLSNLIFKLLVKGIQGCNKYDTRVRAELETLPDGIVIQMGIFPQDNYIQYTKKNGFVFAVKEKQPDIAILFKNVKNAKKVLLGRESVEQAFAKHSITLKGDIAHAMTLVRIINIVENYLFPKFMRRNLPELQKECSSLKIYGHILFGRAKPKGVKK